MQIIYYPIFLLALAVILGVTLSILLIPLAKKINWMDFPGHRKVHESATPLCGGLAIYLSVLAIVAIWPSPEFQQDSFIFWMIIGSGTMLVMGFVDDMRDMSSTLRFLFQAIICVLIIINTGVRLEDFGYLLTPQLVELGVLSIPITVFAAIGVINAFNLSDGLDGLSGSLFLVSSLAMAGFAAISGNEFYTWFLLICCMALLGFLLLNARFPWNHKAMLFLGNGGALMLGFILAWSFIFLGSGPERAFSPITAVWLFAVPLLDTSTVMWIRWREGRSAFSADQNHLHHAFLRAGFSVAQTWGLITLFSLILAGIGVLLEIMNLADYLRFYLFMFFAFIFYFYIKHSWASQRFLRRNFIHHDFTIEEGYS